MAEASSVNHGVTVTLVMDLDEALTLRDVLRRVGGSPETTRRKHTSEILYALEGTPEMRHAPYTTDDLRQSEHNGMEFFTP